MFEYQYIFRDRHDAVYERIMAKHNSLHKPKDLHEFPVTGYRDSYKEAQQKFPDSMSAYYDFVRMVRTGKKFRTNGFSIRMKWTIRKIKILFKKS